MDRPRSLKQSMNLKGILTPDQLAEKMGVTSQTVLGWREEGMPTVKLGKLVYIIEKSFFRWLERLETPKRENR